MIYCHEMRYTYHGPRSKQQPKSVRKAFTSKTIIVMYGEKITWGLNLVMPAHQTVRNNWQTYRDLINHRLVEENPSSPQETRKYCTHPTLDIIGFGWWLSLVFEIVSKHLCFWGIIKWSEKEGISMIQVNLLPFSVLQVERNYHKQLILEMNTQKQSAIYKYLL